MGTRPDGSFSMETLGDYLDTGHGLNAYCSNRPECQRSLEVDIYDLAIQFGRTRRVHYPIRLPIKCSACGSPRIHYTGSPETRPLEFAKLGDATNFRRSRTAAEREALALIFPRVWRR